jgi:hypothetical protein
MERLSAGDGAAQGGEVMNPCPLSSATRHKRLAARPGKPAALPLLAALVLCVPVAAPASARQGCADFSWNVQHERDLFASRPRPVAAGTSPSSAPSIQADHFYDLQLAPQQQVHFVTGPGKVVLSGGDFAGLVKLRVSRAGSYRVAVDAPFWIDVLAADKMLPTQAFQGQRGCRPPRKIVEFVLPADQQLWLQFSGQPRMQVHVTVTRSPPPKS